MLDEIKQGIWEGSDGKYRIHILHTKLCTVAFKKGMSILSIIRFDIIEEILNFYYNSNIKNKPIDDSLHPFFANDCTLPEVPWMGGYG